MLNTRSENKNGILFIFSLFCEYSNLEYVLSLYKILFHFKALLWESIILVLPLPICKAYPIAILMHD